MCFVLYLASDIPVPTIPWDEADRQLNTNDLTELERSIATHFSKRYKKYIGSDQGCGCGFRHVNFQEGTWPEEEYVALGNYTGEGYQRNHTQLHELTKLLLTDSDSIQLYGCWDGELAEAVASQQQIALGRLLDDDFYFRERGFYEICLG